MATQTSYREFGRQVGVTGEYVRRAVAEGKIPADCVGEYTLTTGNTRPCITDPERAALAWGRSRNLTKVVDKQTLRDGAKRGWEGRREKATKSATKKKPASPLPVAAPGSTLLDQISDKFADEDGDSIPALKRRQARAQAEITEMKLEEARGRLVDAAVVRAAYASLASAVKSKLLAVPSKARGRLPHLTVDDVELLEDLIAEALEGVANGG